MALAAGTVDGSGTGTGLALALFDAFQGYYAAVGQTPDGDFNGKVASFCTALAGAFVPYFTANAEITPGTLEAGGDPVTGVGGLS